MLVANPVAIILLSLIFGAAASINLIGAESFLLSVTLPVYAVYSGVAAGVLYWLVLTYVNPRRLKFAAFGGAATVGYALFLATLAFGAYSSLARAVIWFCLSIFAHRFFRWIITQFALRHLDPARSQAALTYLVATYEVGMLAAVLMLKLTRNALGPDQMTYAIVALYLAGAAFIAVQFGPARNHEIRFTHHTVDPPVIDEGKFGRLLRTYSLLAFTFGAFKVSEEYLIRLALKEHLASFDAIRAMVTNYRLVGNVLIITFGAALLRLIRHKNVSPISILAGTYAVLLGIGIGCAVSRTLPWFVAFEVGRWVGENCLFFVATQLTVSSFVDRHRARLGIRQNFFFFTVAGLSLLFLLPALRWWFPESIKAVLLGLILVLLSTGLFAVFRLGRLLPETLYEFMHAGHKTAGILAVNLLSFLRPKHYEHELDRLLKLSPKKLLRKSVILSLGYSGEPRSQDLIIQEFASDQEEIQIAVLDAIRISRKYKGVQFLTKVTRAEVRPKTIRVRINAAAALAAMYGKLSIPFLLHGIDDEDVRIVANTLETLSGFRDRELIPYFERFISSPVPRIRANALMGLAAFRRTRGEFKVTAREILAGSDLNMIASILYVIGKLRDRAFMPELDKLLASPVGDIPSVKRTLVWALVRLGDRRGLPLAAGFFAIDVLVQLPNADEPRDPNQIVVENPVVAFMHFFSQFAKETRMDLIQHVLLHSGGDAVAVRNLEAALQLRIFDFHEELDYFFLLKQPLRG